MHRYLYNGDDLFPKAVNLCARGRNALLDLDLGPGASFQLGLFGPAWEAHLFAVAVDRDPSLPRSTAGRTRLVHSWPVVSTAQLRMLLLASRIARDSARPELGDSAFWHLHTASLRRLRFRSYLLLRHPHMAALWRAPRGPRRHMTARLRRLAGGWTRRLVISLVERVSFSARVLGRSASAASPLHPARFQALTRRLFEAPQGTGDDLSVFLAHLTRAAKRAGLLFDSSRYRAFHNRALLASLGKSWTHGRVSADQLRAILRHIAVVARRFDATFGQGAFARAGGHGAPPAVSRRDRARWRAGARLARLRPRAVTELARLEYILHGRRDPALRAAWRRHTRHAIEADRRDYLRLSAEIRRVRKRLARVARASLTPSVRARLLSILARGEPCLAVGSYYFETEHLMETSSGFTHVGLIKRLQGPTMARPRLWMFDRVLGFHYAYPVHKLTNSVPVQALVLSSRSSVRHRRYRWLAMRVPPVFNVGKGRISTRVTLQNIFAHLKMRLRSCPALTTAPGFYYSGITWLVNHPKNRAALADIWAPRSHTGYGYRTLDPDRLQRLRGRILYVPVLQTPAGSWAGCPPRISSSTATTNGATL